MAAHADAGPSGAHGWLKCPSWVTKTRGRKRDGTIHTATGTAAHIVAELKHKGLEIPEKIVIDGFEITIDDEMLEHVNTYLTLIDMLTAQAAWHAVEEKVNLDWYYLPEPPIEPVYGTADFICFMIDGTLYVVDLKYGQGHLVSAVDNPQLRLYALGALGKFTTELPKKIRMVIVQPRAMAGDPVSMEEISTPDLLRWMHAVVEPALKKIAANDQTETAGDHCKWCVRAGECAALHQLAVEKAQAEFSEDGGVIEPTHLTNEKLGEILVKADLIKSWVDKVRAEVSHRLDRGEEVAGWKLVEKRSMRRWADEDAVREFLDNERDLDPEDYLTEPELKSVAQLEKSFKKIKADFKRVEPYIVRESSGTTLVREIDARPAIPAGVVDLFPALAIKD